MAQVWDYEKGEFVEVPDAKPATPTTTPAPTPAPKAAPEPEKKQGFWGNVVSDAAAIGRSLTQLPGAVVNEVNDTLNFLTGGLSDKAVGALEEKTSGLPTLGVEKIGVKTAEERAQSGAPQTLDEVNLSNVAQAPIARLVPGVYTADKIAKGEAGDLAEKPVTAALDVLPFVGKAGKLATKPGAVLGEMGESAAVRAAGIGKVAKADRITNQGMKLPEIAQEAARRVEERVVAKHPNLYGKTPAARLEQMGLAGERLRQSLKMAGSRGRAFQKDVVEEQRLINEGVGEWEKQGVDRVRQNQLLSEAETADRSWWDQRTPEERGFLHWFQGKTDDLFRQYDRVFEYAGEKYSRSQAPTLYKHWQRSQQLQKILERNKARTPKSPEAFANLQERNRLVASKLSQAEQKTVAAARTEYPAKYTALINKQMRPKVQELVEQSRRISEAEGVDFPVSEEMVTKLLDDGAYRQLQRMGAISEKDLSNIAREVGSTWQEMRAAGADPMYHHHVTPLRRKKLASPRFDPIHVLKEPGAVKRRSWDMEPWVPEATVSLLDQAVDLVQSKHAAVWLEEMQRNGMLKDTRAVATEANQVAESIVRNMSPEKAAKVKTGELVNDIQNRLYTKFTPASPFALGATRMSGAGAGDLFIPKGIAGVIESMGDPPRLLPTLPERPGISTVPMRAFRVSVLYLQPSYYIGNSIGNALMLSARGSPMDLRFVPKAISAWKKGELPLDISMGPVMGTAEESFRAGLHKMGWQVIDDLDTNVWSKMGDRAGRAEAFLQRFAGALDDWTKATAYFAEYNRAAKKGASQDIALARAIEHVNKVNMSFDTLVPAERAVMRGILMPFYSWTRFAMGYIMSYPFDHPWRAAFLNSFSRQIREEWDEGLPQRLMAYWPVGEDSKGNARLYPASGVYPFLSFFSTDDIWAGALRRMSPVLKVAQEFSGIDPVTGGPDPYGSYHEENWKTSPISEHPQFKRPNLGQLVTQEYLPHTEMLFRSLSKDDQEYYKKNPGRWLEDMMRAFGLPHYQTRDLDKVRDRMSQTASRFGEEEPEPAPSPVPVGAQTATGGTWDFEKGGYK